MLTRLVPSWFFGSGADLLNAVNSNHALSPVVFRPIDDALTRDAIAHVSGPSLTISASRRVSSRIGVVMQLDISRSGVSTTNVADEAIDAGRRSFEEYWQGLRLLDSGTIVSATVNSQRPALEYAISGGVDTPLFRTARHEVFLEALAGVAIAPHSSRWVTIEGAYSFKATNPARQVTASFRETDSVRIDISGRRYRPLLSLGIGVRRHLTSVLSLELCERMVLTRDRLRIDLSASPAQDLISDPALVRSAIVSISGSAAEPGLPVGVVFNSNRELSSTIRPSLSGEPLARFTSFSGAGGQFAHSLTAGVGFRF